MSGDAYRRRAAALYDAGIEYLFLWDCDHFYMDDVPSQNRANYSGPWNAVRRLGHRQEIEAWKKAGEPSLTAPSIAIRSLGGWDLTYATPG